MPTTTKGLFFVAKDHPGRPASSTHVEPDGTFKLQVRVLDNQGAHCMEAYRVTWPGEQARAWCAAAGPLKAGDPLVLELVNPRSFMGLRAPEIHATVTRCERAPLRNAGAINSVAASAQPAGATA